MTSQLGFFDLLAFCTFSINAFSYVMRDIKWLRIITIVAMVGDLFVYYNIRAGSPLWVQFGMSGLIIVINLVQLYILWQEKQARHFPGDAGWLYEHLFGLHLKGLNYQSFVQMSRTPQVSLGGSTRGGMVWRTGADIRGMRLGISALDSSTHWTACQWLMRQGLTADDVVFVPVGSSQGVMEALQLPRRTLNEKMQRHGLSREMFLLGD